MKNIIKVLALSFSLLISAYNNVPAGSFLTAFPQITTFEDPGLPDTIYVTCSSNPALSNVIEIRMITDNTAPGDSLIGIFMPLIITNSEGYVTLDTSVVKTYTGTPLEGWGFRGIIIYTPGNSYPGDPSFFPMRLITGGYDSFAYDTVWSPFGKGNHLLARLIFAVSETTKICIDSSSMVGNGIPMHVAMTNADGYYPHWKGNCCLLAPLKGDINGDAEVSISDIICLLNYVFSKPGNWKPKSMALADSNCDGHVTLSDIFVLANFVFRGQAFPCQ